MKYQPAFLNPDEVIKLAKSVKENHNSASNLIDLTAIEDIKAKVAKAITAQYAVEVRFLQSFVFLACSTTMENFHLTDGWHTDGTSRVVDGDCFNAWLPIYVDSTNTGIEVIDQEDNPAFYQQLGDLTQPLEIAMRKTQPQIFNIINAPAELDKMVVNRFSGNVVPYNDSQVQVSTCKAPNPGDLCLFRQNDIHRGFHTDGVRIQLSLKFVSTQAKLNQRHTNLDYPVLRNFIGGNDIHQFLVAQQQMSSTKHLSKHGRLEGEFIQSLLRAQLK